MAEKWDKWNPVSFTFPRMANAMRCMSVLLNRSAYILCKVPSSHLSVNKSLVRLTVLRCFASKAGGQNVIDGLKYTKEHDWIKVDDNIGTMGVTDYAQDALGDIVYAQMPDVGAEFAKGEEFGSLESVKAANEMLCPVSGKVTETNKDVEEKPSLINTDCYGAGWLVKLEISAPEELNELMDAEEYRKFLEAAAAEDEHGEH